MFCEVRLGSCLGLLSWLGCHLLGLFLGFASYLSLQPFFNSVIPIKNKKVAEICMLSRTFLKVVASCLVRVHLIEAVGHYIFQIFQLKICFLLVCYL
ncbi:hypothetical protein HanIR_Chr05g0241491 [Helianthus annuus]|nr:hypothetical protein HanIR_Chr05g0241491 [Helianthus annuus]